MKKDASANDENDAYVTAVIAGLRDGGHSVFRSRSFQDFAGCEQWMQAVKNPISERWTVMRHQRLPDGLEHQEAASSAMCFFDALRTCAAFEAQRGLGGAPVPAGVAHYSTAAEAATVPLDEDGMPHPAANGVILTAGFFCEKARAVAARTKDQTVAPGVLPVNGGALASLLSESVQGGGTNNHLIKRSIARRKQAVAAEKAREPIRKAFKVAQEMGEIMDQAVKTSYRTVNMFDGYFILATAGIGLVTVCPYQQWIEQLPRRFAAASKRVTKAAHKLPDGPERTLVLEFNKNAKALFALGHAAALQERIVEGKASCWRLRRFQNKGLALIDDTAREMGWPDAERVALRAVFQQGKFPDGEVFRKQLRTRIRQISDLHSPKIVAT